MLHSHFQDEPLASAAATPEHVDWPRMCGSHPSYTRNSLKAHDTLQKIIAREDPRASQAPCLVEEGLPAQFTPRNHAVKFKGKEVYGWAFPEDSLLKTSY